MATPALEVHDLYYKYKKSLILQKVRLTLQSGVCGALIAANGQGKTTLLKCCIDLIETQQGHIKLFGRSNLTPQSRQSVLFLPESLTIPMHQTGREFLDFMARLHDMPLNEDKLLAVAQELGLPSEALEQKATQYSKGMRQKLGLILALCSEKSLLLLDEPFSGLDPLARKRLRSLLLERKQQGLTTLMSTHLLHDIDEMYDHIALLKQGCIHFQGSVEQCLTHYQESDLESVFINHLEG